MKRLKFSRKSVLIIILLIALLFSAATVLYLSDKDNHSDSVVNDDTENSQQVTDRSSDLNIRLLLTGDIIGHDSLNANAKTGDGYDYFQFMSDFQTAFTKSDIVFCNQSTLIGGDSFPITGYPSFNAPAELARDMAKVGCNMINTASNHSADKTQEYINSNVQIWDEQNVLAVAGQNNSQQTQKQIATFTVEGKKFAFIAYTTYSNTPPPNSYGVNIYSRDVAAEDVQAARNMGADYVVASMRWGTEYSATVNAQQKAEALYLADQGVDIILGHGPHVLQPVERLQREAGGETIVWYSLGNFLQTQLEPDTLFNAVGVIDINLKNNQTTLSYEPIYMHYEWTEEEKAAQDLLGRQNLRLTWVEGNENLFSQSQLTGETSISAQKDRIHDVLNELAEVKLVNID